jgi:hypothetical protein
MLSFFTQTISIHLQASHADLPPSPRLPTSVRSKPIHPASPASSIFCTYRLWPSSPLCSQSVCQCSQSTLSPSSPLYFPSRLSHPSCLANSCHLPTLPTASQPTPTALPPRLTFPSSRTSSSVALHEPTPPHPTDPAERKERAEALLTGPWVDGGLILGEPVVV